MVWLSAGALAACSVPSAQSVASDQANGTSIIESSVGEQGSQAAVLELPSDACTLEGYWSFFEAFAQSSEVRQAYTDANVRRAINPFRITLADNQWVYAQTAEGRGRDTLTLQETRIGNTFRVEYVRADFGPDDEVVRTHGKPGVYEFRFKDGCWRLTNSVQ